MRLTKRITLKLCLFGVIALIGAATILIGYVDVPGRAFGVGRYTVTVELPESAGLYRNSNVTYRGTEVGYISDLYLTADGVAAQMDLDASTPIPSNLDAAVHSVSAGGEQYIALTPRDATSRPLHNGDVIGRGRTSVPPPIDTLLNMTETGLQAIPRENLKTAVEEAYTAIGGLGPELSRILDGSIALANDAAANEQSITTLIDDSPAVLNSQADTADSIDSWARHLASITHQLQINDAAVAGVIDTGGPAAAVARDLVTRLTPTMPVLLANLVSVAQVGITYAPHLEQILVLFPQNIAQAQAGIVANLNVPGRYRGSTYLGLALNVNLPPPCTTGFLPAQQRVPPAVEHYDERPEGDLYCRIPQDSWIAVRGARNIPCATKPWKRAPTVKMCESDEEYVPLNDGFNWKGDPNATLSGQDIPQVGPEVPASVAVAEYDLATGTYTGSDGKRYTQADLAQGFAQNKTWQSMLTPPGVN